MTPQKNTGQVRQAMQFLERLNLVKYENNRYLPQPTKIHLAKSSPNFAKHHTNWRLQSIKSLESNSNDIHFSGALSLSIEDVVRIKENFTQFINAQLKIVEASKEETAYAICLDFFDISN